MVDTGWAPADPENRANTMSIKLIFLIFFSWVMVLYGVIWYRRGLSADDPYDLKEDFKHTFLRLRGSYSGSLEDGKPRKIAPVILIIGGIGVLVIGLIKQP